MYAATIALYRSELRKNPRRINEKLHLYSDIFNWHNIDFPASYEDYTTFERLNSDFALNVLYVPFEEKIYVQNIYLIAILINRSNNIVKN